MIDLDAIRERVNATGSDIGTLLQAERDRRALLAELDRMSAELEEWKRGSVIVNERLLGEVDKLRAALRWYADHMGASRSMDMRLIVQDGGQRAREALGCSPIPQSGEQL